MSNCIGIQICETGEYLDLPIGFDLRETAELTELIDPNKLKFNFILDTSIDNTPHNYAQLRTFLNPNILDNEYLEIPILIYAHSHIKSDSTLIVKSCTADSIEISLRLGLDHWAKQGKDLKLCDLPYPTVTWDCAYINSVIQGDKVDGINFPYVSYGRLVRDYDDPSGSPRANSYIIPNCYQRPWYYVTPMIKKGLCELGWDFKSPFLESEVGCRIKSYLFDKNYGLGDALLNAQGKNKLSATGDKTVTSAQQNWQFIGGKGGTIVWDVASLNNWNQATGAIYSPTTYTACGEVNAKGKIRLCLGDSDPCDVEIKFGKMHPNNDINFFGYVQVYQEASFEQLDGCVEFEFEVEGISMTELDQLGVGIRRSDTNCNIIIEEDSFIDIEGIRCYPQIGDQIDLSKTIDKDYLFLDFLKGVAHALNLKIKTNFVDRCVEFYQPYDGAYGGENHEGFFIENDFIDLSSKVDVKSKNIIAPVFDDPRCVVVKYKDDSNDECLEKFSQPLWSKKIDRGTQYAEGEQTIENPFFAPLAYIQLAGSSAINVPKMDDGSEFGFNFCPRLSLCFGNLEQNFEGVHPVIRYCDEPQTTLIPTSGMYLPIEVGPAGGPYVIPEENLVFDVNEEFTIKKNKTLYTFAYERWLDEESKNMCIQYLVNLSFADFRGLCFRNKVCFQVNGRLVVARLKAVNDFHYCTNILTPVDFRPDLQKSELWKSV